MKDLMRISEVAEQYNISRTALIHYDNIDLLKPFYRNEKEYRFYNQTDLSKLELIIALRESGLSIKEIKSYFNKGIDDSSVELLVRQQKRIDAKIKELKATKRIIAERVNLLKEYSNLNIYEGIKTESYSELVLAAEQVGYGPLMSLESAKKRLKDKLPSSANISSKFGVIFDITFLFNGKIHIKYVTDFNNISKYNGLTVTAPASLYIATIHYGTTDNALETVKKMAEYAQKKHLTIGQEAYFVPLFNHWEIANEDEFVNEILIPCIPT